MIAELPFEFRNGSIRVPVRVNGSAPLQFTLNSGLTASMMSKTSAGQLGLLRRSQSFKAQIDTGWDQRWKLPGIVFDVGGLKYSPPKVTAGALPNSNLSTDGILGADLFERFVVELDFSSHTLRLHEPVTYQPPARLVALPLELRQGQPVIKMAIARPSKSSVIGDFFVSTDWDTPLFINSQFANTCELLAPPNLTFGFRKDTNGCYQSHWASVPEFQLGSYSIEKTEVFCAASPAWLPEGAAGMIGLPVLEQFNLVFDYSRHQLLLEKNANFSRLEHPKSFISHFFLFRAQDEFLISFCGAVLAARAPDFSNVRVVRVRNVSAAQEAGLKPGDLILTLDGQPPEKLSFQQWMRATAKFGRVCRLEIQRGDKRISLELKAAWTDSL